jgi:uncharacterized SAM-binding protein YcdF (DUF218 family)
VTYTQPLLTIFLVFAAVSLWGFQNRRSRMVAGIGICGLFLLSWPPAAWLFSRPLEARYPIRPFDAGPGVQALVVFSENIEPARFERPYPLASQNTYERCLYTASIYRRYGPIPVVVSGGEGAATMKEILVAAGVAEALAWTEERSSSTYENALYSSQILQQHGITRVALIVDATSMPRAAACFRKLGIEVVPAPSRFYQLGPLPTDYLPGWKAVRQNEDTLHEALGLLWYRLRGWI